MSLGDEFTLHVKKVAVEHFLSNGNIVEPVIVFRKDGEIQEPLLIRIPPEILGTTEIQDRIHQAYQEFVFSIAPQETAIIRQAVFVQGDITRDCLSFLHSTPQGDRTHVIAVLEGQELGVWQEIEVGEGELYGIFDRAVSRWN